MSKSKFYTVVTIYCKAAKMHNVCSVASSRVSKVQFHKFPKNMDFQNLWIDKCGRKDDLNPETGRVCETHFFNDGYFESKTSEQKN